MCRIYFRFRSIILVVQLYVRRRKAIPCIWVWSLKLRVHDTRYVRTYGFYTAPSCRFSRACFFMFLFPLGLPSVPMTQRNLPASFWNQPSSDQTPQPPTSYPRHNNSLCLFQQNASEGTTYYSTGCRVTNDASHVSLGGTATNAASDTYAFSVSCAQLASGVVESFPPRYLQQGPQPLSDPSRPLLTQETDVDCNEMQTSFRFNPSYNDLLIQPKVKPQLPVVSGEPAR